VQLIRRQFTWDNNVPYPTYEKLDRVLVSSEWDLAYPLAVVTSMNRDISDHMPLLLKYGSPPCYCNTFIYENFWVERDRFFDIVSKSWNKQTLTCMITISDKKR
jgi:hypothetical protein